MQDVHVHLPGWTGGPDAVWDVPGPRDEDGMSTVIGFTLSRDFGRWGL